MTARSTALTNSAKRALWLKTWSVDTASKSKLCGIPFMGYFYLYLVLIYIQFWIGQLTRISLSLLKRKSNQLNGFFDPKGLKCKAASPRRKEGIGQRKRAKAEEMSFSILLRPPTKHKDFSLPVGRRLQGFIPHWASMTENQYFLGMLSQGYKIEFPDPPPRKILCNKPARGHNKSPSYEEPVKGSDATGSCDSSLTRWTSSGFLFPYLSFKEAIRKFLSNPRSKPLNKSVRTEEFAWIQSSLSRESVDQTMLHGIDQPKRCVPACSYISPRNSSDGEGGAASTIQSPPF